MNQHLILSLLSSLSLLPALTAQTEVTHKWRKDEVCIKFNPVRFGKHSLSELPVGGNWRMGMNTASQLHTGLPLFGAEGIVAPGSYRVSLTRKGKAEFALSVAGTQHATGAKEASFPGQLKDAKASDKLSLRWGKASKPKAKEASGKPRGKTGTQAAGGDGVDGKKAKRIGLQLNFGPYQVSMPVVAVGSTRAKVRGYRGQAFTWPAPLFAQALERGQQVPVLTLRGKRGSFNLLVGKTEVKFLPWMAAPTGSFGFAGVKGFDAKDILKGEVTWSDAENEVQTAKLEGLKASGKSLKLSLLVGKRVAKIEVPLPPRG